MKNNIISLQNLFYPQQQQQLAFQQHGYPQSAVVRSHSVHPQQHPQRPLSQLDQHPQHGMMQHQPQQPLSHQQQVALHQHIYQQLVQRRQQQQQKQQQQQQQQQQMQKQKQGVTSKDGRETRI